LASSSGAARQQGLPECPNFFLYTTLAAVICYIVDMARALVAAGIASVLSLARQTMYIAVVEVNVIALVGWECCCCRKLRV
jgi:hypothetical protein